MKTNKYQIGEMKYGYSITFKKWEFEVTPGHFFMCACKGTEAAHTVACYIVNALDRTNGKGLDNVARNNITRILS